MNLDQARQAVEGRGFDYLPAPRIYLMLNTAKDTFEDIYEWPWLHTVTTGPTPLNVPDLKLVLSVKAGANELYGLDVRQVLAGGTDLLQAGAPGYWWLEGDDTLHAYPGNGADVTLAYVRDSPPLEQPADTPLIPARYHPLWIDLAVCEAYRDSDNFSGAQALRNDITFRLQDVIARYETRNRQHSPFMTVRTLHGDD